MNCPEDNTTLTGVYAYMSKNSSRYKAVDFRYCATCNTMYKIELSSIDSRPKKVIK